MLTSVFCCLPQLVSDLGSISDQLGSNSVDSKSLESEFYSALLSSSAKAGGDDGAQLMAKYSDLCKRGLSSLVAALQSQRNESQRIIQLVSSGSADQALQAEITVLKQERTSLIKQNDELLSKDRQRKRVEQELRREAEAARAAEKIAVTNANDVRSTLAERIHQLQRLSHEYEKLQRSSKDALAYKENKEAEEAAKASEAAEAAQNGKSHQQDGSVGPADPAVRTELEETKAKLTKVEAEAASLLETKKQMINEVEDMRQRLHSVQVTEQDFENHPTTRSLRRQVESQTAEIASLKRDCDHWKKLSLDAGSGRDQQLQRENDRMRDEISHLRSQAEDRTRTLKQMEQDREKLKFELDQSRTHQHSAETVRTMLDSIKRLTEDRNRAAQDYENARREVQKLQADVQRLSTSDAKSLHLMIENLESQVAEMKAAETHLKQELAKQEPVINAYKMGKTPQANELVELSARVQVLQDENAKLRTAAPAPVPSDVGQLQLELEQSRRKVVSLEKQLAYYISELDAIMPSYEELNATSTLIIPSRLLLNVGTLNLNFICR
jgi:DNA repair exonuclease SbcCD ATPase subunit